MFRSTIIALLFMAIEGTRVFGDVPPFGRRGPGGGFAGVEEWWSPEMTAWIGGGVGGTVGILGGVIGTLAGLGRARTFTLTTGLGLAIAGVITLQAGIAAFLTGQPNHVFYPLLMLGGVCTLVFGINYPVMTRRYDGLAAREKYAPPD